jgi:hypothetical protein
MRQSLLALTLIFLSSSALQAQYFGGARDTWNQPTFSSTLEEGAQRGYADIVRSQGMANLMNSQAAKEFELARREYIQNRMDATQTYFEMRRYNQEARAAARSSPLSTEQYVRLARERAPARLSVSQLDPFTGKITWPAPLRRNAYASLTGKLDELFAVRAHGTVLAYGEIQAASDALLEQLRMDLRTFTSNDYILARNFVTSLAREAQIVQ